ncbi:MAG: hypothetical protein HY927_07465 [Elusimicrobia bacterium]|nr:hypothetical protein [Elusimicrobiota bacterium]
MSLFLCFATQWPSLGWAAGSSPDKPAREAFPGRCEQYCGFIRKPDAQKPEDAFPEPSATLRQTLVKRCRPEAPDQAEREICQCCVCVVAMSSQPASGLPPWLEEPVQLFRKSELGTPLSTGALRGLPVRTEERLARVRDSLDRMRKDGPGANGSAPLDNLFDGSSREGDLRDAPGAAPAQPAGSPRPAPQGGGTAPGGSARGPGGPAAKEGVQPAERPAGQSREETPPAQPQEKQSFLGGILSAVGGFFKALFSVVVGIFKAAYRMVRDLILGPPDPLDEVPLPDKDAPAPKPHPVFVKASARFNDSIRPFLTGMPAKAEEHVARTFPKPQPAAGNGQKDQAAPDATAQTESRIAAPARQPASDRPQDAARKAQDPAPKDASGAAGAKETALRSEPERRDKAQDPDDPPAGQTIPRVDAAPRQPAPRRTEDAGVPLAGIREVQPPARAPPEKTPTAQTAYPPVPPMASANLGERVYDLLCWGFMSGSQKEVIELARKEVRGAALLFSRYVSPSLMSHLSRIFVDVEHGSKTGAAAALRLDTDWSSKWYRVGVVTARFLHTINQAERMISGVLLNLSGLMVQAGAVELELRMLEVGLEKGSQSPAITGWAIARRRLLRDKKARLAVFMKKFVGTEVDLSSIVSKADEDYLAAVAREAKDGYLTDVRTKRWVAQRVEELLALIDEQVSRKAALEALKMAMMAEKDLDPLEKRKILEKFLEVSRSGKTAQAAADAATEHKRLRAAVWESQEMFPLMAEAGSHMRLAQALRDLAVADLAPQLRAGFEIGWSESSGKGAPDFGVHLRWAVTAALRLLWSSEDLDVSKFEAEVARMDLLQAGRDQTYNLERSGISLDRYADKLQSGAAYPNAEDIALYGRARQVLAINSLVAAPQDDGKPAASPKTIGSLEDLLKLPLEDSPKVAASRLRTRQGEALVAKSKQWFNLDAGFGGGVMVLDSALPSLVLTLENLGHQREAAQVRRLGASLREAQRLFETMYAVLHFANDYLYTVKRLEEAQRKADATPKDSLAFMDAEEELIEARYTVLHVKAELKRQFGDGIAMPDVKVLERIFSLDDDRLYWGNPLFKQFNMDAQLSEVGLRAYEDLMALKEALDKVPSVRIHLTGLLLLILSPGMPWLPILLIMDGLRTGLPLLSALLSSFSSEQEEKERAVKGEAYAQILKNREAAKRLAAEYGRRREYLRSMASSMPLNPRDYSEAHQLNRWRIATLAYELSPGAEAFVSDRIRDAVAKGDPAKAASLWRATNAGAKLEAVGASPVGDALRAMLNSDGSFIRRVVEDIVDKDDWFEKKLHFDSWLEDFRLDFGPADGGRIVKQIVEGCVKFMTADQPAPEALAPLAMPKEITDAVARGDLAAAYALYEKKVLLDAKKASAFEEAPEAAGTPPEEVSAAAKGARGGPTLPASGATGVPAPGAKTAPDGKPSAAPEDAVERRALTQKVVWMVRNGQGDRAKELLASASDMYQSAGLSFDRHYPGLRKWASDYAALNQSAAPASPEGLSPAADTLLQLRSLWLGQAEGGFLPVYIQKLGRVIGYFRLVPDWDLAHGWSSLTVTENFWDRVNGTTESNSVTVEKGPDGYAERQAYSFNGPMGCLGDLRFYAGVLAPMTRGSAWNPFDNEAAGKGDSYYGGSLTQHLVPGFDLTERITMRLLADGRSRSEYGTGAYFMMGQASGAADITLIRDDDPKTGRPSTHYRGYGYAGYGTRQDDLMAGVTWQTDDLYGRKEGQNSGEYNLSGQVRVPVFPDPYRPEVFWSATYFNNRQYLTSGRYYRDMYTKNITYFMDTGADQGRLPDGAGGYAGLRQMLVDGKFGGVGMGYVVQSDPATGRLGQYRTLTYAAPGNKGQIDLINSDDPAVGPLAVQAQVNAGNVVVRAGADASEYTLIVGGRTDDGDLTVAGRVNVPADDRRNYAVGASLGTEDSSYQVLWAPVSDELRLTLFQGNWWLGNGVQFDYRTSKDLGDRFRFSMALGSLADARDWTLFVPFAPLAKKLALWAARGKDELSPAELEDALGAAKSRSELAQKAGQVLEGAETKLKQDDLPKGMSLFGELATDIDRTLKDFEQDGRTRLPVSWKPAFADFLQSLSTLAGQLKLAEADRLYEAAGGERVSTMWAPRVVEMLDEVLRKYEAYRRAYREQIMAIPVFSGNDKRPQQVAEFNARSQWFVDYVQVLRKEFLEMKHIGQLDDKTLREQLTRLYRLKEESPLAEATLPKERVHRFLQQEDWLPTTPDIPVRVLENRIGRLLAEEKRREAISERIRRLEERSRQRQTQQAAPPP